jgi:hypothetical protein
MILVSNTSDICIRQCVLLLPGDVDLWPINPNQTLLDVDPGTDLVITNVFCCGNQLIATVSSHPVCHTGTSLWLFLWIYIARRQHYRIGRVSDNNARKLLWRGVHYQCCETRFELGDGSAKYVSYRFAVGPNLSGNQIAKKKNAFIVPSYITQDRFTKDIPLVFSSGDAGTRRLWEQIIGWSCQRNSQTETSIPQSNDGWIARLLSKEFLLAI